MAVFQMDMHGTKRVRVNARPELGLGEVLRVQESAGQYLADVVFQVGEHRILEIYPAAALESVPTIFERYLRGEEDFVELLRRGLEWPIPMNVERLADVAVPPIQS